MKTTTKIGRGIRKNMLKFLLIPVLTTCVYAQNQFELRQVIVLNEGAFGGPATVGSYDPAAKTYVNFDTIPARFATDVIISGNCIYVAADTLLIKYNLITKQRLAVQTVKGIRELASWNNQVLITRAEITPLPSYFQVYDAATLNFLYELPGLSGKASEVKVLGDTAYVAVNDWGAMGKLAVVDLQNQVLNREIDLGADGLNPEAVRVDGNRIYTVNSLNWTNSSVTRYEASTSLFQNIKLNTPSSCSASTLYSPLHNIYFQVSGEDKLGVFNAGTLNLIDTLYINKSIYGIGTDSINGNIYTGVTDYSSYGEVFVYDFYGMLKDSFSVGISPGTFAFDVIDVTGMTRQKAESSLAVYPNPSGNELHISSSGEAIHNIRLCDITGRVLQQYDLWSASNTLHMDHVQPGIYLLKIGVDNGVITKKIVRD